LHRLREMTSRFPWLVVSGGAQQEMREIFAARGLDKLFNGGIYGSPESKTEILAREVANGNISGTSIYIGHSSYDHRAAMEVGLDFVFVSRWAEFSNWPAYCTAHGIEVVESLSQLCTSCDEVLSNISKQDEQ